MLRLQPYSGAHKLPVPVIMSSTSPEADFDLEKLFLPAWAQETSTANRYAKYTGNEGAARGFEDRAGGRRPPRRDGPRPESRGPSRGSSGGPGRDQQSAP